MSRRLKWRWKCSSGCQLLSRQIWGKLNHKLTSELGFFSAHGTVQVAGLTAALQRAAKFKDKRCGAVLQTRSLGRIPWWKRLTSCAVSWSLEVASWFPLAVLC